MALWRLRQRRKTRNVQASVYSRWDGTQTGFDPTAFDIMEQMKDELLYHGDPMSALRQLLAEGFEQDGERISGLREMLEKLRQQRQEKLNQHNLDGFYDDLAQELQEVLELERQSLDNLGQSASNTDDSAGDAGNSANDADSTGAPSNDTGDSANDTSNPFSPDFHQLAEKQLQLDMLPNDLPGQLKQLENYEFTSPEAERRFYELLSNLREQLMEDMVQQLTQQAQNMTPDDMRRVSEMLAELNDMLQQRADGIEPDFDNFMDRFGDMFPENPESLDELLENLANRMAAMQALMNSMSPDQRAQMEQLAQDLLGDMDFNWQMNQLAQNLQSMFPNQGWDNGYDFSGVDPLDFPSALELMQELGDMDELANFLSSVKNPGALNDVDIERVRELLGDEAAQDLQQLSQLAKKMEDAGLVQNNNGEFELTPKAIRRLGQHALADLFSQLTQDRVGGHELHRTGVGHEKEFTTKPYEWGDPFNLHIEQTIRSAITRTGGGVPVRITPDDFMIEQTENLVRSSTVLLLDLSLSMPMRGNFLPAKKIAIALHALITSQYPRDYLGIVTFSDIATEIKPQELPLIHWEYVHGTNMQHALILARKMLANESGTKQVIMITDGEPTAHITDSGQPYFAYPPAQATINKTLTEVMRCTKDDIRINVFMLDATDYLAHFVEQITKLNGGRAFYTTPETLGDYVLVDFVEHKRNLLSQRWYR